MDSLHPLPILIPPSQSKHRCTLVPIPPEGPNFSEKCVLHNNNIPRLSPYTKKGQ